MDRVNARSRILTGVLLVLVLFWLFSTLQADPGRLTYDEFVAAVEQGRVEQVRIQGQAVDGRYTEPTDEGRTTFSTTLPGTPVAGDDGSLLTLLEENGVAQTYQVEGGGLLPLLASFLLPLLLFVGVFWFLNRQARGQMGPLGQIGKSTARLYKPHEPTTRFADVAGYREVKEEVREVVAFLREPDRFRKAGAEVPKGMLLVGPPGTGKTLLARATAGEAGVPFITVTGSDFMEMFVGVGASRVRDLFKTARANAPCIIFIDELDSIGRKRGAGLGGGHDEREQTLNQLLGEIDGFEGSEGVVIMAATNRPDVLDPALQRPGRFDRQIVVPLPTLEEREEVLRVHAKGKPIAEDVDLGVLARGTPGMAGADLKNLINEAALIAVRGGSDLIRMRDIEQARERHTIGRERASLRLDEEEKRAVAYHEGGHALAAFLEEEADPVYKVTVLPVGMALGVTTQLPIDERHIYLRSWLDARLKVMLGGRAAGWSSWASRPPAGSTTWCRRPSSPARSSASSAWAASAGRLRRQPAGLPRRGARPRPRVLRAHRRAHRRGGARHPRHRPGGGRRPLHRAARGPRGHGRPPGRARVADRRGGARGRARRPDPRAAHAAARPRHRARDAPVRRGPDPRSPQARRSRLNERDDRVPRRDRAPGPRPGPATGRGGPRRRAGLA